ncbi:MAG: sigma-54 dependent transcriptional regulator, partial [Pseudomonadota bacterium]
MSGALQQTLLVIDTDPAIRRSQADALATAGYRIQLADGEDQARTRLSAHVFAAVIFDAAQFPEAKTFMEAVLARDAGTALICVTSDGTLSGAVAAMRFGCADVLAKPASPARLRRAVKDALSAPIKPAAPAKAAEARQAPDLLGRSAAMRGVISLIDRFAPSTAPVLVTGESGTGKEVCAQALHSRSVRASAPFVALNCAALPKELMESEIFGHVRGAFTGADSERVGAAMAANGGTLFLDEIGEMDISLQAKLLRFLQTGEVKRVGSDAVTRVDVRIVCATNRLLPREIAAGRFREDLYYRLNILSVHMPPLRARGRDIIELASHFRSAACAEEGRTGGGFATDALEALANHRWPGNVRELQNIIRRAVILSETGHLTAGDLF